MIFFPSLELKLMEVAGRWMLIGFPWVLERIFGTPLKRRGEGGAVSLLSLVCLSPGVFHLLSRCWRAPTRCVFCKLCTEALWLVWDTKLLYLFPEGWDKLLAYPGIEKKKPAVIRRSKRTVWWLPHAWVMPQPGAGLFVKSNSNKKSKQTSEQNRNQN